VLYAARLEIVPAAEKVVRVDEMTSTSRVAKKISEAQWLS
jgi:hypothetical protein